MEKLGYGPNKRLAVTVSTRNTAGYLDPAVIAIDQMKEIYIDGTLEPIETANWFPKVIRKDYTVGANISETAVDDPDQMLYENYACGSDRNYTGFCDKEVDALIDRQSAEPNAEKRRRLVWEIERRRLASDHLLYPCRDLLVPTRESLKLRFQQLALRGRVAECCAALG
jgi:peptide/nickel transport system substrate-binding protein